MLMDLIQIELGSDRLGKIREATQSNRIYGSNDFINWVERELSVRVRKKKAGRPRMQPA